MAEVGYKPKSWLEVTGYAGNGWGQQGWTGGARVGVVF
jgi:hypothetical protein